MLFLVKSRGSVRKRVCVTSDAKANVSDELPPGWGLNYKTTARRIQNALD